MERLDQLSEITDHVLSGLQADESLKHRILLSAAGSARKTSQFRMKTIVALCSLSVLVIILCIFVTHIPFENSAPAEIRVIPAGSHRVVSPVNLQQAIDQASELDIFVTNDTEGAE